MINFNENDIIFLLGAGASADAGIPVSSEMVKRVEKGEKIKVDEEEINARLEQAKKMLGGEEEFKKYLKQSKYTLEQFKKDLASDIKATLLMEQQMGSPTVTVAEAKEYFDEHKSDFVLPESVDVSHILIKVAPDTIMATQKMIKAELRKIKKDILAGKITFEEAAKKYSECPTAKDGGKVGVIYKNDQSISLPFSDAAFSLPVSNISDVVETEFGDHLIFVTQKDEAKTASFEEIKYKLIDYLTNKKKQDLAEEWTIELRTKANVKYK